MAKNRLFGIGEPLTAREGTEGVSAEKMLELVDAVGFGAWRAWMHIPDLLENPSTPNQSKIERYTKLLEKAAQLDIEVTGMSHEWFLPEGCKQTKGWAVPTRDLTPGSLYMQMLHMLEESWHTLVSCFPQVTMWQVGNEWNSNDFLHPDGFLQSDRKNPLTLEEKMDIAVDLMYFSAKGIRSANPQAKVVSFSPCPLFRTLGGDLPYYLPIQYAIAQALEGVYSRIVSGKFWSDKTDDYFDMLSWHPYMFCLELDKIKSVDEVNTLFDEPGDLWKDWSDAAYRVMRRYGDGHKKVLLTEFGFQDCGKPEIEAKQAEYYRNVFELCKRMPYIHTVHAFRLLEDTLNRGGENQEPADHYGFFKEAKHGFAPRKKAIVLQELAGGTEDLHSVGRRIIG
ncbi:hypothetical protein [Paenibacillus prosopidis]|uniref:Cellulase (Glycosyl hydrolase family 5) n=1 Tax=Paenibacillus prosopidis TaxID=630520 RepID=A0A368VVQ7_9BACL|nr:hypothetical protein [Paenibacillus prosopidis]RCW43513.1 hypothetical protein DFP97_113186 [Paenibacillus prosopidis]